MSYDLFGPADAPGAVTVRPTDSRSVGATDTWFKDCTNDSANDGTAFQAAWFNGVLADLRALARGNGNLISGGVPVVPEINSDDSVLLKSVQNIVQRGQTVGALDTGSANSIVVTLSPAPPEYKMFMPIVVKIAANNTGATQINVNGLGLKTVTHINGTALIKDELVAGQIAELVYDGTNFQLVSIGSPAAHNRVFTTGKTGDQALSQGVQTDVTWDAATCAFGTFNGVTFTFTQAGTYIVIAGVWVSGILSAPDYLHTGGNFIANRLGGLGLHGFGDSQSFATGVGGGSFVSFGHAVAEWGVGDTLKIQAASAATAYWTSGAIRQSGQTFLDIARVG